MKDYYVYAHKRLTNGETFYIGKGRGARVKNGENKRNPGWHNIVDQEFGFKYEFLHKNLTEAEAFRLENEEIRKFGIHNLTNMPNNSGTTIYYEVIDLLGNKTYHRGRRDVTKNTPISKDRIKADANKGPINRGVRCKCNGWQINTITSDQYYSIIKTFNRA